MLAPELNSLRSSISALTPADDIDRYLEDASGLRSSGSPVMVFRPRSALEVSRILTTCRQTGHKVSVQGGRTGLAGGAVPDAGDVVISMELMNRVETIDPIGGTATVQAGCILETVCEAVESLQWYFPMDCGARASCQIGGNIATNAGGNRVLRYGTMRELVLGLEVVLPNGRIVQAMDSVLKNNTGLDWKQLFIGTEGTLGIITRAVLRLFPLPRQRASALVALSGLDSLVALLKAARGSLPGLSSFEVMWHDYLVAASQATGIPLPFSNVFPLTVLLETESFEPSKEHEPLHLFLETCLERGSIEDAVIPGTIERSDQLWNLRDAIGEILRSMVPYVAFDISIPLHDLEEFTGSVIDALDARWPKSRKLLFGHLGDGNLHLSTGPYASKSELLQVESLVYEHVARVNGSISAEHGIGRSKKSFLHHSRTPDEIELMKGIMAFFDPGNTLNPGRIIDLSPSDGIRI